jgi:hypothetical protein
MTAVDASPTSTQPPLGCEVTTGSLIDEAFRLIRSFSPPEIIPAAAALVLHALLIAGTATIATDAVMAPDMNVFLSAAAAGLILLEMAVGVGICHLGWQRVRGPLPPGPSVGFLVLRGLILCPALALFALAPAWLLFPDLSDGRISLLHLGLPMNTRVAILYAVILVGTPFLALAPSVLAVESGGAARALFRSVVLFVRSWPRTFLLILVLALIVEFLAAGLSLVVWGFDGVRAASTHPGARTPDLTFGCARLVVHALLAPAMHAALFLAYVDARVRLEGLDVERAAREAGLWGDLEPTP